MNNSQKEFLKSFDANNHFKNMEICIKASGKKVPQKKQIILLIEQYDFYYKVNIMENLFYDQT